MKDYCFGCEYLEHCETAGANFCANCKDYSECDICYEYCRGGYAVECNNGFEPKDEYGDDEE